MIEFIDDHRVVYGGKPLLRHWSERYYAHLAIRADPSKASARQQRDAALRPEIQQVWDANSKSTACAKPGTSSDGKALMSPVARWRG